MLATDILMDEHRVIERVLDSLERAAEQLQQGKDIRPGFFSDTADFVKGFADGCHHKKEEDILFPAMLANGVPRQGGPVGVMLAEHEQGRAYVRAIRSAAARLADGDLSARDEIVKNSLGYVALLRAHIQKENQILFPMATQVIPISGQSQLAEDFEHIEHEETGAGVHEKYLALAEALEKEAISQPA